MNIYQKVRQLDKNKCRVWGCSEKNGAIEVHHIIPRSQGGATKEWNLICLCSKHHRMITTKKITDIEILTKLKRKRDFRWQKALEWHKNKDEIRKLKE